MGASRGVHVREEDGGFDVSTHVPRSRMPDLSRSTGAVQDHEFLFWKLLRESRLVPLFLYRCWRTKLNCFRNRRTNVTT